MKIFKFFAYSILGSIGLMLNACAQQEMPLVSQESKSTIDLEYAQLGLRTEKEAINLVNQLGNCTSSESRSGKKTICLNKVKSIYPKNKSRFTDYPLMYAVPYDNNEGYVLVSTNKDLTPILAIIDDGEFDEDQLENLNVYQNIKEKLELMSIGPTPNPNPPITPDPIIMIFHDDTIKQFFCGAPKVKVQWGQGWPENSFVEGSKYAGCGPVAAAQILSYFENPKTLALTFRYPSMQAINIDWEMLKQHKKSAFGHYSWSIYEDMYCCGLEKEQHEVLGLLCRELGKRFNTEYLESGAYTYYSNAKAGLQNILSDRSFYEFKDALDLYNKIYSFGGVAYVSGEAIVEGGTLNHAFVADAIAHIEYTIHRKYEYNPLTGAYSWDENLDTVNEKYIHCNWGDCGTFDGYFNYQLLNPKLGQDTITPPPYFAPQKRVPGLDSGNYSNRTIGVVIS